MAQGDFDELELRALYQRQFSGERLSRSELARLARWEKAKIAELRREVLQSITKKEYLQLCGRPQTTIERQARTYGLTELGEGAINLAKLIPQFHDLLAKHWVKFSAAASDEDLLKGGGNSKALERYRAARAEREELELSIRRSELVSMVEMRPKLVALARMARGRFEAMERAGGPLVRREIDTLINDWIDQVERWYPEGEDGAGGVEFGDGRKVNFDE